MEKLKACPHCGGKAVFERFNNPKNWYVVRCTVCGCQTDGFRINHDDATDAQNKSANAAVWNRRAEPENKALTLEQLRKMDSSYVWLVDEKIPGYNGWYKVVADNNNFTLRGIDNDYYQSAFTHGIAKAYARKPEGGEPK